jgi:hypothetical protein
MHSPITTTRSFLSSLTANEAHDSSSISPSRSRGGLRASQSQAQAAKVGLRNAKLATHARWIENKSWPLPVFDNTANIMTGSGEKSAIRRVLSVYAPPTYVCSPCDLDSAIDGGVMLTHRQASDGSDHLKLCSTRWLRMPSGASHSRCAIRLHSSGTYIPTEVRPCNDFGT